MVHMGMVVEDPSCLSLGEDNFPPWALKCWLAQEWWQVHLHALQKGGHSLSPLVT